MSHFKREFETFIPSSLGAFIPVKTELVNRQDQILEGVLTVAASLDAEHLEKAIRVMDVTRLNLSAVR